MCYVAKLIEEREIFWVYFCRCFLIVCIFYYIVVKKKIIMFLFCLERKGSLNFGRFWVEIDFFRRLVSRKRWIGGFYDCYRYVEVEEK